jgi:DNA polymerase-3 subunit gamma/tau
VRRLWPDIVDATKLRRRVTWIHLTQNAQVVAVDDRTLTLGFANAGARDSFDSGGSAEIVRQAAIDVVGTDWRIETIVDPGANPDAGPPPTAAAPRVNLVQPAAPAAPADDPGATSGAGGPTSTPPSGAASVPGQAPADVMGATGSTGGPAPQSVPPTSSSQAPDAGATAPRVATDDGPPPPWAVEPPADLDEGPPPPADRSTIAAARDAIQQTRPAGAPSTEPGPDLAAADAEAHPDDEVLQHDEVADAELLARELGARVIEEIKHT